MSCRGKATPVNGTPATPFLAHRPPKDWLSEARAACGQFSVVWLNCWVNLAQA